MYVNTYRYAYICVYLSNATYASMLRMQSMRLCFECDVCVYVSNEKFDCGHLTIHMHVHIHTYIHTYMAIPWKWYFALSMHNVYSTCIYIHENKEEDAPNMPVWMYVCTNTNAPPTLISMNTCLLSACPTTSWSLIKYTYMYACINVCMYFHEYMLIVRMPHKISSMIKYSCMYVCMYVCMCVYWLPNA
jgi:hypothetical protein